jgi:hypothetical protein
LLQKLLALLHRDEHFHVLRQEVGDAAHLHTFGKEIPEGLDVCGRLEVVQRPVVGLAEGDVLDNDVMRGWSFEGLADSAVEGIEDVGDSVDEGVGVQTDIVKVGTEEVFMLETIITCQKEEIWTVLKIIIYQEMVLKLPSQWL